MKRFLILTAAVLVLTGAATPAEAEGWAVRGFGVWMDSGLDEAVPSDDDTPIRISSSSEVGFGLGLEYRFENRIGLEVGVLSADPGVKLTAQVPGFGGLVLEDGFSTTVVTLDLNVHLTPADSPVDFYIGGGVASMSFGSLRFEVPDDTALAVSVNNDTSWSLRAGVDIPFGDSGWGLTLGIRHVDADFEAREREDAPGDTVTFSNNLLIGTAGFVYSFQ